jgi:GNAT superfamily N-acetyltransferase
MPIAGKVLELAVRRYWTERFDLKLSSWERPGSKLMRDEIFEGSDEIYFYHFGDQIVLRMDPAKVNWLNWPADMKSRKLGSDELSSMIRKGYEIRHGEDGLNFYLDPDKFRPAPTIADIKTRPVDPVADDALLREFLASCTEAEVDEAEIYLNEPDAVIFGGFHDGRMVSYGGHRYWGKNIADIGVLTHPDFRHRGLGKSIVSTLCEWCIANDVIPMYRVTADHFRSRKIAEALGFEMLVRVEVMHIGFAGEIISSSTP